MFGLELGELFSILGVLGFFVVAPIAIIILLVVLIRKKHKRLAG
jgi:hypothetical protein